MATNKSLLETNIALTTTPQNKTKSSRTDKELNTLQKCSSWPQRRCALVSVISDKFNNATTAVLSSPPTMETRINLFPTDQNLTINNASTQQQNAAIIPSTKRTCWTRFKEFHFKNLGNIDNDLILFHALSIIGLICYTIIDTIMYSSTSTDKSEVLQFLHGSRYIALEIFLTVYTSGVAAFGVSVEIYILVPYVIATCILVAQKCDGQETMTIAIIWIFKITFTFIAVEMNHWNFRKYHDYERKFNKSARALQRQALIFSVSMLFLSATGLTALYAGVQKSLPLYCPYDTSHCGIVELYEPLFSYDNDKCLDDLRSYVTAREQLRVIRDFMFLNGVSYAVFNCNILDVDYRSKFFYIRSFLIFLYVGLATSVLVAYVDPFYFIKNCRLAYNIVELVIFIILFLLPGINLYKLWRKERIRKKSKIYRIMVETIGQPQQQTFFHEGGDMDEHPDILPRS